MKDEYKWGINLLTCFLVPIHLLKTGNGLG